MALSAKVVEFTITASGSLAVTGAGFQPKLVILAATSGNSTAAASYSYSIGAATSSTARWAMGSFETDGAAISETSRVCKTDKVLSMPSADGSTVTYEADFTSMDSDGFTINVGTYSGVTRYCAALCLGGTDLDVAVGSFQTGTTTGANRTAVSGLSFQPKAVFCASTAVATGPATVARMMYGMASGASNEWVSFSYANDNNATMSTAHAYKSDAYLYQGAPTATVNIEIDFNSWNADGWDHNVTTAANDFLIGYVALGGSAQVYVGNDAQKTTAGTEPTTGVGFTPIALLTSMGLRTTSGSDLSTGDYYAHLGMMEAANEIGFSQFSDDGTADSEVARGYDSTYSLFAITDDATPTVPAKASLTSFDADGFTVNWNAADGTARLFGFLAIGAAAGSSFKAAWAKGSNVILGVA